jgi:hypothetical protein
MLAKIVLNLAVGAAGLAVGHFLATKSKTKKPIFHVQKGDMVQWECRGAFVFPTPKKVERLAESEAGTYVFVEDTCTGIPIEQIVLIKRADEPVEESDEPRWSNQIVRHHPDYVR